jgi:acetyl-CoA acetyltransferase
MTEIVIAGGMRTPFGDFGKALRDVPLVELGAHIDSTLAQFGLPESGRLALPVLPKQE